MANTEQEYLKASGLLQQQAAREAAATAQKMADKQPSDRALEQEQAYAANREISQLEAVASGDYSGITADSDSYKDRQQKIRAAQRTNDLLYLDVTDPLFLQKTTQEKMNY